MRLLNVTLYFHLREGSVFQSKVDLLASIGTNVVSTKLPSNVDISKISFSV